MSIKIEGLERFSKNYKDYAYQHQLNSIFITPQEAVLLEIIHLHHLNIKNTATTSQPVE